MALIILEGVDGSGKSTLARAIAEQLDQTEIIHSSQLKEDALDAYALRFEDYAPGSGANVVCDRLHWGELIYGPLYREESALSEAAFRWAELYLRARGAVSFHVSAPLETIERRLRDRGEDFLKPEHVQKVWESFADVEARSLTGVGSVLPDENTIQDITRRIILAAKYYEGQAQNIHERWPGYIGHSMPAALLVGDVRGGTPPHPTRSPFIARGSSSGIFLMNALQGDKWRQVGIININDEDIDIPGLLDVLGDSPVVALGRKAHETLDVLDVPHGAVPHPQYMRRFRSSDLSRYGATIIDVIDSGKQILSWQ